MIKKGYLIIVVIFITLNLSGQTIVIDPGHGYNEDGSSNRTDTEILTVMAVSDKLYNLLSSCSFIDAYLTRTSNDWGDNPSIMERALMANNWGADRILSVHCNAGGGTGTETFWCDISPSPDNTDKNFAIETQTQMVIYGNWYNRRVVEDHSYLGFHLGVLKYSNAAGCLNEIGFVDTNDSTKLLDNGWRNIFAEAYFEALQNNLGFNCECDTCPDIVIEDMWTAPSNPVVGENVDLYVKIKNTGNVTANSIYFDYIIDGNTAGSGSIGSLSPNETKTEHYNNYTFDDNGNYNYCVYIGAVENEQNTANNSYCINITVNNSPEDIFLTDQKITSSTTVDAGKNVNVEVYQNYSGSSESVPGVYLYYYISTDCYLDTSDIYLDYDYSNVNAVNTHEKETDTLTIPAETTPGTYYILFVGDATNVINESNEDNNTACVQINVENNFNQDLELKKQIIISPNPVIDILNFEVLNPVIIKRVVLINKLGQTMKITDKPESQINISELSADVYFVKFISDDEKTAIFKIVKK